ncbi:peptidoglycan-binding domain-containing protein [Paracoccus sp. S1E-3]|uniref:peptidoglycan-binding domain-containing protein n=1 Tax=Paracoccus sp. S1E-3 TaxID=2756130 RepID=UPI0015EED7D2|nr:peptidoglycan-binding domain-containing protein [Paracoccus sp. S1E-3]MBA4489865.1 peptidoglycan-binding protein [Paracoccus sp. S1E-3]
MKRLAILLLSVALPGVAAAEDVYIRIEAKRGAEAAMTAAAGWQDRVGDLPAVVFPLNATWTAIALGPMPREEAETRIAALKAAGTIPGDSLLTPAEGITPTALPDGGVDRTANTSVSEPVTDPAAGTATGTAAGASTAGVATPSDPVAAPTPPAPDRFIRLEAFQDRAEADTALAKWRETIPEAGLWQLPDGWFAIAVGPLSEAASDQWRKALAEGKAIPEDSLVSPLTEMGSNLTPGSTPDWPANPETPPEMPPLAEVQELLKWVGIYDGEVDGKSGPQTRAAIAAGVASQRSSADPALAMRALAEAREAWRGQMGLAPLTDDYTGLSLTAPMQRLAHERTERALSIYGPKDESGAALILFSQPGGQQEMLDMMGLVTALGWVPAPERVSSKGKATLSGQNETHIGRAEARVADGQVEGWVLIWPVEDAQNAPRVAAEIRDSFARAMPTRAVRDAETAAPVAGEGTADGTTEGATAETPAVTPAN